MSNSNSNKSNLSSNIKSPNIISPNIKIKSPDPSLNLRSPKPRLHSKDLESNNGTPGTPGSAREYKSSLLRKVNSNQKTSQYSSQSNFKNNLKFKDNMTKNKPEYRQYAANNVDSNNASRTFFTDNKNYINSSTSYLNINESNLKAESRQNVHIKVEEDISIQNIVERNARLENENKILKEQYEIMSRFTQEKNDKILELNSILENKNSDIELKDNYIVRLKLQLDDLVDVFRGIKKDIQ